MNRMTRAMQLLQITAAMALGLTLSACGGSSTSDNAAAVATGATAAAVASAPSTEESHATVDDFSLNRSRWWRRSTVSFASSQVTVAQNAGAVSLPVTRIGNATAPVSIAYSTKNGTAVAGTDYSATSGTLQWAENDSTSKTISVPINNAAAFSGKKSFTVALGDPSTVVAIGSPSDAVVTISGDAAAAVGSLELSGASYAIAQNAGNLTVTVNRTGGSSGAVSVAYTTANGTASAGTDYTAATGTLDWSDGDASAKTFTVAISNASPYLGSKTFSINLSDPMSGATLGSPSGANVTIAGDATAPSWAAWICRPPAMR